MSKKAKYSKENIKEMKWPEVLRLRPEMYIGHVNMKGFLQMLKGIISSAIRNANANSFFIELKGEVEGKLRFNNPNKSIVNSWGKIKKNAIHPLFLEFFALNALSEKFEISFWNVNHQKIGEQYFEKGVLISEKAIDKINCSFIEVKFLLDKSIWGALKWNTTYITHHLRAFAYLYKKTKFELRYRAANEDCRVVYHFKNGLKDRVDIEILNGLGGSYFETHIDEKIDNFHIEVAFAFRDYSVDAAYLKSYACDYLTSEHGTHVDGLLKGLTYGVMKYFQKEELTEVYKISEKGMKENLIAVINVKLDEPVFSGCVKNKLANSEIIEPIASYIAEIFFKMIEENEEATERLIRKFAI